MKFSALALTLGMLFNSSAFATQAVWDTANPWGSLTPASYAEWNVFNSTNDNTPDVAMTAGITASVQETTGGAFITGGGNIYSFSGATAFTATLSGASTGLFDVYLRIATLGTLANSSATLNGVTATSVLQFNEDQGTVMGGATAEQELYWKWSNVAASSLYTFKFNANSSSMSLDQLALAAVSVPTVTPVPEPEAFSLMGLGLGLMAFVARRNVKKQA